MKTVALLIAALAAVVPLFSATPARSSDLTLRCEPIFAIEDGRSIRPDYLEGTRPSYTFFLFSNTDLLLYKILVWNQGSSKAKLRTSSLKEDLVPHVKKNGVPIPSHLFELRAVSPFVETFLSKPPWHEFAQDSEAVERFLQGPNKSIDAVLEGQVLPDEVDVNEKVGFVYSLTRTGGEPLEPALWEFNFTSQTLGISCEYPQTVVAIKPETDLDVVEDHQVRYNYFLSMGDEESALQELIDATGEAPANIKGWFMLAEYYHRVGDLESMLEVTRQLETLIERGDYLQAPVSLTYKLMAGKLVAGLEELEAKVEAQEDVQDLGHGDLE